MRKIIFLGIAVWLVAFSIYVKTGSPTLLSCGDSAELVTASYTLGVPHAPGYPIYAMLGKLFSLIPFGTIAQRYCIFTGFFASLAAVNLFLILFLLTRKALLSLAGGLTLAFSYHFWLYGHIPEISALNIFFVSLLFLILLGLSHSHVKRKDLLTIFFIFVLGLSLAHHHSMVLLFPGFAYYLFIYKKNAGITFAGKRLAILIVFFLLGLLPYMYLPIRARAMPYMNAGNINSIARMADHFFRKAYGTFTLTPEYAQFIQKDMQNILGFYMQSLVKSFGWLGVAIGIAGFGGFFKREKKIFLFLFSGFLITGPLLFIFMRMPPYSDSLKAILERFLIPGFFIFSIGIGYGFFVLCESLPAFLKPKRAILLALFMALPLHLLMRNYPLLNLHDFRLCEVYGRDLMKSFEKNAVVLVHGDTSLFTLWYLQQVGRKRPDLKIVNVNITDWYREQFDYYFPDLIMPDNSVSNGIFAKELIKLNFPRYRIYQVGIPGNEFHKYGVGGNPFVLQPKGLAMRVVEDFGAEDDRKTWDSFEFDEKSLPGPDKPYFVREIVYFYALAHYNKAALYHQNGYHGVARREAEKAYRIVPSFTEARNLLNVLNARGYRL
jgi:hypothetical protein